MTLVRDADYYRNYRTQNYERVRDKERAYAASEAGKYAQRKADLKRYGITPEEYDEMLASQNGACAICRTSIPGGKGRFHVDHNHTTGLVRGLLCHGCNVSLGHFGDDPSVLEAAAAYLRSK